MQMGACLAVITIESSMLGATHALANPLTERFDTNHGIAIACLLPHVVRWNSEEVGALYGELSSAVPVAERLEQLLARTPLPTRLSDVGIGRDALPDLVRAALEQSTGKFNPRPLTLDAALALYEAAY